MAWLDEKAFDSYGNKVILYAEETGTDAANNTSTVHAWLDLYVVNGGSVKASGITVGVSGASDVYLGYQAYSPGTHKLIDGYFTVNHNNDGSGSTWVSGKWRSGIGNKDLGGTLNLSNIQRYPVLNSGTNFTDRTNPVYNITAYETYDIKVKLEAANATRVTRTLSTKNSTVYTLELTNEERKLLRNLSSNGKTLAVRETVCAVSNGQEISWSYKDYTMTIVKKPVKIMRNGSFVNSFPYIRVNGQWKEAKTYIRVNGNWKEEK